MKMKLASERGNALFIVLIAIALFGALTIAISNSGSGQADIDDEKLALMATEMAQVAAEISDATNRLIAVNGCTAEQISYAYDDNNDGNINGSDKYYNNSAPADNSCNVFHELGGGLTFPTAPEGASTTGDNYHISGASKIQQTGTNETELVIYLKNVDPALCDQINVRSNGYDITDLVEEGDMNLLAFRGIFYGYAISFTGINDPPTSGCLKTGAGASVVDPNMLLFYSMLLKR